MGWYQRRVQFNLALIFVSNKVSCKIMFMYIDDMEYKNKQKILLSHVLLLSFLVLLYERTLIFIFKLKKGKSQ